MILCLKRRLSLQECGQQGSSIFQPGFLAHRLAALSMHFVLGDLSMNRSCPCIQSCGGGSRDLTNPRKWQRAGKRAEGG